MIFFKEIKCPNCGSSNVLIQKDGSGFCSECDCGWGPN